MSDTATPAAPAPAAAEPAAAPASAPPQGLLAGASANPAAAPAAPAPAGTPVRFFGDAVATDGNFKEGWTQNLQNMGFERLANKAALAKDEATFFKTMDETLGLVGKKAGIAYPKPGAEDSAIAAFRADAGVPDSPEGYNLKPAELPAGIDWSDETAGAYAKTLHAHHVPAAAAQELVKLHLEQLTTQTQSAQAQFADQLTAKVQESETTFRKEWGGDYENRLESNRAFIQSRLTPEELSDPALATALSHPALVRMVDEARLSLREPASIPGLGRESGSTTHSARQQAIEIQKANPNWEKDPALHQKVTALYNLDATQAKRAAKR